MTQEGTNVYALNSNGIGTINYDIANDLNIIASKDTYSYTSEESTKSAGGSVGTNGVQFNYDQSDASSKVRSATYNNVDIIGNNINIKTGNNTDIKGANVLAQANENNVGGNINMDTGNNLNIESLQDSYYAKSKSSSFGISAGGGKGKDGISASAGFNFGKTNSTTDSQWVNNQTSIIADNNVNIRTNNNTNLIGSVVASNSDNLSLNTGSLTYSDLNDFYREETKGYNFGTSVGGNRTDQKETNLHPQGSTTIGLTHTGQEKEQITRATIGLGNITINSEPLTPTPLPQGARDILAGLNRNVNNSQEITKDIITGALNGSMTIDNRVFTSDGRKEIVNQMVNLPGNIVKATAGATGSALNILESAYNGVKNLSIDDAVDSWKANQSNLVAGQSMSSNDKSREVINNLSEGKSQQDIENALNSGFAKYDDNGNIINTISLYNDVNDNNKGTHQNSTGDSYINSAYTDMTNTSDVLKVASHENAHNYTKNEDLANASQKYTAFSYFMGNVANLDSVNKNGTATNTSWNNTYGNTQHMNYNTSVVRGIRPDDRSNFRNKNGVTVKDMLNSDEIENNLKEKVKVGKVSFEHESLNKFNAINCSSLESCASDPGGVSYGVGQIASLTDGMEKFANYLEENANFLNEKDGYNKNMYEEFLKAGGVEGAKAGTEEFRNFWKEASQYSDFAEHQVNFLYQNNYEPNKINFEKNTNLSLDNYSDILKNAIYSFGVNHSVSGNNKIFSSIQVNENSSETEVLKTLYKARIDYVNNLNTLSEQTKKALIKRYEKELNKNLKLLNNK